MYSPFPIEEEIEPSDKLDNGSGLIGHRTLLLCFQDLPTSKEITVHVWHVSRAKNSPLSTLVKESLPFSISLWQL